MAAVIAPGAGELIGDSPERRVEILCEDDALHATWSRYAPGRDGADLHVHRRHSDLFYVLAGELTLRAGPDGTPRTVPAGMLVCVPPLVVHGFRNASPDTELRYLNVHAPGCGFAGYLRAMRDGRTLRYDQEEPPADGGRSAEDIVITAPPFESAVVAVREAPLDGAPEAAPGRRAWLFAGGEGRGLLVEAPAA
jgi:mannose-6-phosphate isomerase-like protein (cupin superfamily)